MPLVNVHQDIMKSSLEDDCDGSASEGVGVASTQVLTSSKSE